LAEPSCEMCGKPAVPTPLGTMLCPGCARRYREFLCRRCGQRVIGHSEYLDQFPWLASGICSTCQIQERLAGIPEADRAAIRDAAGRGTLAAVKEARKRLGWSITDAVSVVELLRDRG
jgi:hypothetical protein